MSDRSHNAPRLTNNCCVTESRSVPRRPALNADLVAQWSAKYLSAAPVQVLFETGHLSQVVGLRLDDERKVVVKVRQWQNRLISCSRVQRSLFERGFPAPEPIAGPAPFHGYAVSAETLVEGGQQLADRPGAADLFSASLYQLVRLAPDPERVGSIEPSPPWVGWDHPDKQLWPTPDDRDRDLNAHNPGDWLDQIASRVRIRLAAYAAARVVGHGDWYSQNLHWLGDQLHAVHDWDSVVAQPEAAIAGHAAAVWPGSGGPGEVASIQQTEQFITGYSDARGRSWSREELEVSWAAGLWNRAFDAKKASLVGDDPDLILTRSEANERARRAGLSNC